MRILVIEDDVRVADFIVKGLKESGHLADHVAGGNEGLLAAMGETFDVLVVDRMLPGIDGLTIVRSVRASNNRVPILLLSALAEVDERVKGLRAGGDDYLTKPFAFSELLARIETLARRSTEPKQESTLEVAGLKMDVSGRVVSRNGDVIELMPREFRLLEYLLRHAGQVVTRTMLLEGVWDYHFDPRTNVIDVHISRLRKKVDKGYDQPLIHTIRGAGYVLRAENT
ncbi:winged helix-turn-helix domain-containing protein [Candidatus Rariloculus sp.]|uniref:winged helix-turn-helix domain-containing protein n=1 Tax=Candidatus Rariloculus sp. TaxID=3101265 RepID=UPI003D0F9350